VARVVKGLVLSPVTAVVRVDSCSDAAMDFVSSVLCLTEISKKKNSARKCLVFVHPSKTTDRKISKSFGV